MVGYSDRGKMSIERQKKVRKDKKISKIETRTGRTLQRIVTREVNQLVTKRKIDIDFRYNIYDCNFEDSKYGKLPCFYACLSAFMDIYDLEEAHRDMLLHCDLKQKGVRASSAIAIAYKLGIWLEVRIIRKNGSSNAFGPDDKIRQWIDGKPTTNYQAVPNCRQTCVMFLYERPVPTDNHFCLAVPSERFVGGKVGYVVEHDVVIGVDQGPFVKVMNQEMKLTPEGISDMAEELLLADTQSMKSFINSCAARRYVYSRPEWARWSAGLKELKVMCSSSLCVLSS